MKNDNTTPKNQKQIQKENPNKGNWKMFALWSRINLASASIQKENPNKGNWKHPWWIDWFTIS